MKAYFSGLLFGILVLITSPVMAELSVTTSLVTDYLATNTGQSQTDHQPALQASLDYQDQSGIHASIWASTLQDPNDPHFNYEVDYVLGFQQQFDSGWSYDLGLTQYEYPSMDDKLSAYDYLEFYAQVVCHNASIIYWFSPQGSGNYIHADGAVDYAGNQRITQVRYQFELNEGYALTPFISHIASHRGQAEADSAQPGLFHFWHWGLALTKDLPQGFSL